MSTVWHIPIAIPLGAEDFQNSYRSNLYLNLDESGEEGEIIKEKMTAICSPLHNDEKWRGRIKKHFFKG